MRQRILLISALIDDPKILILDELLSGLDVTSALILKNLDQGAGAEGKSGVLLLACFRGGGASLLTPAHPAKRRGYRSRRYPRHPE